MRDYSATQTLSVLDQLRAGVRFLDVRVTKLARGWRDDDRLWCCHGQALCVTLEEVIMQVNTFHAELRREGVDGEGDGLVDVPVVLIFRHFSLSDDEVEELTRFVTKSLEGGIWEEGDGADLRVTPLGELPRNIVAGLQGVGGQLPTDFGHDAWLNTFRQEKKIRFLRDVLARTKSRECRDDFAVVGFTVTAHIADVVCRIVSVGLLRPSLKTEAIRMNSLLPCFVRGNEDALARVANVVFVDFLTPEIAQRIDGINRVIEEGTSVLASSSGEEL